jgi:rhodanese-related sulfurtransferase
MFVVISSLLVKNLFSDFTQGGSSVDTSEATRLINREDAILLDIRSIAEFSEGHILNAINIPFTDLDNRTSELEKFRDRAIIIYCKTGVSAGQAATSLNKLSFKKIHRLKGGIENWKQANLPLAT